MNIPSMGGISEDNLAKAMKSSNSALLKNIGRIPPIYVHKYEALFHEDCSSGPAYFIFFDSFGTYDIKALMGRPKPARRPSIPKTHTTSRLSTLTVHSEDDDDVFHDLA